MSGEQKDIYDFSKLEDMFDAIDTLTRATAAVASVDKQLAADLARMTNTLIELSQNDGLKTPSADQVAPVERDAVDDNTDGKIDLDDLTVVTRSKSMPRKRFDEVEDVIIDVLTGQPVEK